MTTGPIDLFLSCFAAHNLIENDGIFAHVYALFFSVIFCRCLRKKMRLNNPIAIRIKVQIIT